VARRPLRSGLVWKTQLSIRHSFLEYPGHSAGFPPPPPRPATATNRRQTVRVLFVATPAPTPSRSLQRRPVRVRGRVSLSYAELRIPDWSSALSAKSAIEPPPASCPGGALPGITPTSVVWYFGLVKCSMFVYYVRFGTAPGWKRMAAPPNPQLRLP